MSILFEDARLSTRSHGRWTTGLWLSVVLHALVVVVLIVVPIRASEEPSTPRTPAKMVRVVIFVVAIVVILALPFWLGTGPALLSP